MFTREVNAIHDGLYARLTIAVREPIKFLLLIVFALLINVWLALATFFAAGLVWLVGRQTAIVFRRRGRIGARRTGNQLSLLEESLPVIAPGKRLSDGAIQPGAGRAATIGI